MTAEAESLRQFTNNLPREVAKATTNYGFGPKESASSVVRELAENALARFVVSYLSNCQCSVAGKQLLISCPNIEVQFKLRKNFQRLQESDKLVELLDASRLEGIDEICLMYPVGKNKKPNMGIVRVRGRD